MFQEFPEDNKGDDFLNEFRQKIADQSSNNIEERRNEMKRSKSVFIGAVSGVALAGVVGWFILAPQYSDSGNVEIPVIRRPQTAVKVQPSEPGGMEILNQDKSVYDIIEKKTTNLLSKISCRRRNSPNCRKLFRASRLFRPLRCKSTTKFPKR